MKTENLKINLSWPDSSILLHKHPKWVKDDINAGLILFTESSVTVHIPYKAIGRTPDTLLH